MKKAFAGLFALCFLLLTLAAVPASAQQGTGKIYLYGENHSTQAHLDQELAAWKDFYHNQRMRDLFIEVPSYTAAFMNLWIKAEAGIFTRPSRRNAPRRCSTALTWATSTTPPAAGI